MRDAELTDVAAYLADTTGDVSLRAPTGKAGLIRVDQVHLTPALAPTVRAYERLESDFSDHHGIIVELDLEALDASQVRQYT